MEFWYKFSWYVVIFGVDNSSSSQFENCKNNFLILREGKLDIEHAIVWNKYPIGKNAWSISLVP